MLTVNEFCEMFTDPATQKIEIFDNETTENVWEGVASEIPVEYQDLEIDSIDTLYNSRDTITLNVSVK